MTQATGREPRGARLTAVAALLAASVLLSRVLGFVRESAIAYRLGVGSEVDAYRAAFQIPDLLNYFLAGGAFSVALIPLYQQVRAARGEADAEAFFAKVLGTLSVVAVVATGALWWNAEALVRLQFGGFDAETLERTVRLTRIVLPAQIFFVAGGIVRAVLMARGRFLSQALAPLLYNAGIIAGGLALPQLGADGFAWGVLAGAFVGNLVVPFAEAARDSELRIRARVAFDRDLRRYLVVAAPLMIGVTLVTVDEWYDRWFGARLAEGTVAALGFARFIGQAPVAVLGQAVATAALPMFSKLWSEGRRDELDELVTATLRAGLGVAILAAAALAVLAEPIVEIMYERGSFGAESTARVSGLLVIFALALPAWVGQQIALRAFYARTDMWRPMLLGTAVAVVAIPLYLHLGSRFGAAGLASAGVIAMTFNAVATIAMARVLHGSPSLSALASTAARGLAIAALAAAGAWYAAGFGAGFGALGALLAGGIVFAAVAVVGAFMVGDEPMRDALGRVARRLRSRR